MWESVTAARPRLRVYAAALFLLAAPAWAGDDPQTPPPAQATTPPTAFEEVTVTARLIEEKSKTVPGTVTRLDSEEMEQQGVVKASDLMYAVPSLTIHPYFNTLTNFYS